MMHDCIWCVWWKSVRCVMNRREVGEGAEVGWGDHHPLSHSKFIFLAPNDNSFLIRHSNLYSLKEMISSLYEIKDKGPHHLWLLFLTELFGCLSGGKTYTSRWLRQSQMEVESNKLAMNCRSSDGQRPFVQFYDRLTDWVTHSVLLFINWIITPSLRHSTWITCCQSPPQTRHISLR